MRPNKSALVDQKIGKNSNEKCNKRCSTRSDSFIQLNICGSQKGIGASSSDKPEKSQSVHALHSFQNEMEGLFLLKEMHIFMHIFSPTKPKVSKICKF